MKIIVKTFLYIFIILTAYSCTGKNTIVRSSIQRDSAIVKEAERFTINKNDSCTIVTIIGPWQGGEGIKQVYYLVRKGNQQSYSFNDESVIYVPLKRVICMSSTHLAMVSALGMEDAIVGVSGAGFIYNNSLSEKIAGGLIKDIGYESGINSELIIKSSPELIMMYGIGSESAGYIGKIKELGTKVMFNADYLETDPLGKAEWIKLFGALFCKEELADSIFQTISDSYKELKKYISENTDKRPSVLLGLPFRDTWFISPGNSYISRLISDAGGRYLWQDTKSSYSMPYSLENVYMKSLEADFWLNIGSAVSKEEIASYDSRLEDIPCFSKGNLFNNNKRLTAAGGNDYWESGTLNPHLILKDIASILHPGIFNGYEMFYYRKIE